MNSLVHVVRWSDRRHIFSATNGYQSVAAGDVAANAGVEILAAKGRATLMCSMAKRWPSSIPHCLQRPLHQCDSNHSPIASCSRAQTSSWFTTCRLAPSSDSTPARVSSLGMGGSLVRAVDGTRSIILAGGNQAVKFVDASGNNVPQLTLQPVFGPLAHPDRSAAQRLRRGQRCASLRDSEPADVGHGDLDRCDQRPAALLGRRDDNTRCGFLASASLRRISVLDDSNIADHADQHGTGGLKRRNMTSIQATTVSGRFQATDADGDPLRYSVSSQPTRGT